MGSSWVDLEIKIPAKKTSGNIKTGCPKCQPPHRADDTPLSINLDLGVGLCHHCGYRPIVADRPSVLSAPKELTKRFAKPTIKPENFPLSKAALFYFEARGISRSTLKANSVCELARNSKKGVCCPVYLQGELVNGQVRGYNPVDVKDESVKWFSTLVKGGLMSFDNLDTLIGEQGELITNKWLICEGYIDRLSLWESGYLFASSVPNGAPDKKSVHPNLEYLDSSIVRFISENVDEIILCPDADEVGQKLMGEIATRLGIIKCSKVEYPAGCKDLNDVLMKFGTKGVIDAIESRRKFPVEGIIEVLDLLTEVLEVNEEGITPGFQTGIEEFDATYSAKPGYMTLLTGTPEAGKSVLLDNLNVGYAENEELNGPVYVTSFTPESFPLSEEILRLASIHTGQPMDKPRIETGILVEEVKDAVKWVAKHFSFIQPRNFQLDEILRLAEVEVQKKGCNILVVDPYNRLERPKDFAADERQWIRHVCTSLQRFARLYKVAVFLVVHPPKPTNMKKDGEYPLLNPYSPAGGADWNNMTDVTLGMWRSAHKDGMRNPHMVVLKSKKKEIAKSGQKLELKFDPDTYIYNPASRKEEEAEEL